MGSYLNFKNFRDKMQTEGNNEIPIGSFSLTGQSSIYSLTLDEFQNSVGKDFGSMNMDELLKNIWTAEETQAMASSAGASGTTDFSGGNLQRQGSLTLPRTLSQKTVDEVWRDLLKESGGPKDGSNSGGLNMPQRQPTLGEMTLEEFLFKAGVVQEDAESIKSQMNGGFYVESPGPVSNNNGFTIGGLANQIPKSSVVVPNQNPSLGLNTCSLRSSQPLLLPQQPRQLQPQPLFPKQTTVAFGSPMENTQLASLETRIAKAGKANSPMNNALVQGGVMQNWGLGMPVFSSGATTHAAMPPLNQMSSNVTAKSSTITSSLSPFPYMCNEGIRGGKCGAALEKVQERRQRRMIKNRESATRSRARKQAYTFELEEEIAKMKELNQELQKKQVEIMEMHKNQILETIKFPWGNRGECLKRTLTGPW